MDQVEPGTSGCPASHPFRPRYVRSRPRRRSSRRRVPSSQHLLARRSSVSAITQTPASEPSPLVTTPEMSFCWAATEGRPIQERPTATLTATVINLSRDFITFAFQAVEFKGARRSTGASADAARPNRAPCYGGSRALSPRWNHAFASAAPADHKPHVSLIGACSNENTTRSCRPRWIEPRPFAPAW